MNAASTTPPRASIHGRRTRDATAPSELEPPSKRTRAEPLSIATVVPSPIANIVHSKCGRSVRCSLKSGGRARSIPTAIQAATRIARRGARNARTHAAASAPPTDQCTPPIAIDPAPQRIASSTSPTCSHANSHIGHASTPRRGGQTAPTIALGYAITSVAVESGAQRSVSAVPYGWSEPKWTSTIGALATKAASPAAIIRPRNSPASPTHAALVRLGSSRGIHASQRRMIGADRCRSAITHAKLSWKPAPVDSAGSMTSMTLAATARTASPFQSRPSAWAEAPTSAINAERTALAAGAMTMSAPSAASPHAIACTRGLGEIARATSPTIQPSTARLKPEIARMCDSPTARNECSIVR
jgi:hypothetical protein